MDSSEMQRQWLISDKLCHVWDMSAWLVDQILLSASLGRFVICFLICYLEGCVPERDDDEGSSAYSDLRHIDHLQTLRFEWVETVWVIFHPDLVETLLIHPLLIHSWRLCSGISFYRAHASRAKEESSFSLDFDPTRKSTVRFKEKKHDKSEQIRQELLARTLFHDQSLNRDPQSNHEIQVRTLTTRSVIDVSWKMNDKTCSNPPSLSSVDKTPTTTIMSVRQTFRRRNSIMTRESLIIVKRVPSRQSSSLSKSKSKHKSKSSRIEIV